MSMHLTLAICMYNAERYIEETLQSVMDQTKQDFHLLIVDDCSNDDSVKKVEAFFTAHPRQYELVRLEENKGICHARHFAERHATNKYMMFLDADDVLLPKAIEKMYDKITSDNDLMAVGCYLAYIDEKSRKIGGGLYLGDTEKDTFYKRAEAGKLIFMQPTAIYDRELALGVGGYDDKNAVVDDSRIRWQDYCEDLDLWTRMSDLYHERKAIIVLPEVLCHYRKLTSGMSANSYRMSLRMRYVKNNVRRRRRGESNMTFEEYYRSLSANDLASVKRDGEAADALRNGVLCLRKWNVIKGIGLICHSIALRPGYIFEKIKYNLLRK